MNTNVTMENTCCSSNSLVNYECRLPEDLIQEILVRVPVKSLLRFKLVCKYWKTIITHPSFGNSQFQHSNKTTQHMSLSYILVRQDKTMFTLHLNLNDLYDKRKEGIKGKFVPISPTFDPKRGITILSSSNGLLCVHIQNTDNIVLWNPTTNESRLIPSPIGIALKCLNNKYCGAGYVPSTNDYKIVCVGTYSHDYREPLCAKVYSLRENTWRNIDCISSNKYVFNKSCELLCEDVVLLSNALHWIVTTDENYYYHNFGNNSRYNSVFVIKFDLVKEVFRRTNKVKVKRKGEALGSFGKHCRLGVAIGDNGNNHLCICDMYSRYGQPDVVEMWVLDERDYTLKKKFRVEGTRDNLRNDHSLLKITGYGEVVIFEKKPSKWETCNNDTRLKNLRVFDARQPRKSFSVRVSNEYCSDEYCLPYRSGAWVYQVVDFVPTLLSPNEF